MPRLTFRRKCEATMVTTLGKGRFLKLVCDAKWEFVERVNARGVVAVTAITADRRILLTDQFRPAVGHRVIDLPSGLAGDIKGQEAEDFADSALRELLEETGFEAKKIEHVADCPTSPGLTSEIVSMFMVSELRQINVGGGVNGEQIDIHIRPLRGIEKWLSSQVSQGKLIDQKVYAGLYFAKRRTPR